MRIIPAGSPLLKRVSSGCSKWIDTTSTYSLKRQEMKQINFTLVFLLFIGVSYAQEQAITQTKELDTTQIEEIAVADAKADFGKSKKLVWGGGAALTSIVSGISAMLSLNNEPLPGVPLALVLASAPIIAALIMEVEMPEERQRQLELANVSQQHRSVYRTKYISEIKKRRLAYASRYSLTGVGIGFGLIIALIIFFGATGTF